ncbi:MAG: hypothetical protein PHT24_06185 [Endomicrobiaceae bacterium]|nr:hypothetical protein [Endomicrobiaceae bacterium]
MMEKNTQRIILNIIRNNDGELDRFKINRSVSVYYAPTNNLPNNHFEKIDIAIRQLEMDDKIIIQNNKYCLTPKGYKELDLEYKKFFRFIVWERHNLFSILAILISLTALVVSIVKQ